MMVSVNFLSTIPRNVVKYHITYRGSIVRELPDLMTTRYYEEDRLIYETTDKSLPMNGDIIEYDRYKRKWYIVE